MDTSKRILPEHEEEFPNLFPTGYGKSSEEDEFYNCFAFAADKNNTEVWWTPVRMGNGFYWPEGLDKKTDINTFIKLYKIEGGFEPDENNSTALEGGIEKVALYVDDQNEVTHAARQLEDGSWASKLGDWEDVEHNKLEGLSGDINKPGYGKVVKILKRERIKKDHPVTVS
jgi:hypothetical protein